MRRIANVHRVRREEISGVPQEDANEVISDFESEDAQKIEKIRQADGNWTVIATFVKTNAEEELPL